MTLLTPDEIRELAAELAPPDEGEEVASEAMSLGHYRRIVTTLNFLLDGVEGKFDKWWKIVGMHQVAAKKELERLREIGFEMRLVVAKLGPEAEDAE